MATRQLHKILNLRCLRAHTMVDNSVWTAEIKNHDRWTQNLVALSMKDERRSAGDQMEGNLKSYRTMFRWACVSKSLTGAVVSTG